MVMSQERHLNYMHLANEICDLHKHLQGRKILWRAFSFQLKGDGLNQWTVINCWTGWYSWLQSFTGKVTVSIIAPHKSHCQLA